MHVSIVLRQIAGSGRVVSEGTRERIVQCRTIILLQWLSIHGEGH